MELLNECLLAGLLSRSLCNEKVLDRSKREDYRWKSYTDEYRDFLRQAAFDVESLQFLSHGLLVQDLRSCGRAGDRQTPSFVTSSSLRAIVIYLLRKCF